MRTSPPRGARFRRREMDRDILVLPRSTLLAVATERSDRHSTIFRELVVIGPGPGIEETEVGLFGGAFPRRSVGESTVLGTELPSDLAESCDLTLNALVQRN